MAVVEDDRPPFAGPERLDPGAGPLFRPVGIERVDEHDVDFPGGERHERGLVVEPAEHQAVESRSPTPVRLVGDEDGVAPGLVGRDPERPGPDR